MSQRLVDQLTAIAEPLAASLGLRLWGIEISSGQRPVVRVFLESAHVSPPAESADDGEKDFSSAQGVSVEQCASFSRLFGLSLDVEDVVSGAYVLEVSSPGFERTFFNAAQLAGAVSQLLDLTLVDPPPGFTERRKFRGRLLAGPLPANEVPSDAVFVLRLEDEQDLVFRFEQAKKVRQVFIPPEKVKPGKGGKKSNAAAEAAKTTTGNAAAEGGKKNASASGKKSKAVGGAKKAPRAADTDYDEI